MDKKNLIIGIWKFNDNVGEDALTKLAKEWCDDDNYLQLYIRRASKDQLGLGFVYRHNGKEKAVDDYFDKTTDLLKRRFGNDYVGWDLSSDYVIVKGF